MPLIMLLVSHAGGYGSERGVGGPEMRFKEFLRLRREKSLEYAVVYSPRGTLVEEFRSFRDVKLIPFESAGWKDATAFWRLYRLIKELKPDLVHSQGPISLDFQAAWACALSGVDFIVTRPSLISDYLFSSLKKRVLTLLDSFTLLQAKVIVAVSQNGYKALQKKAFTRGKLKKIVNGVDTERFHQRDKDLDGEVCFGTVAQFTNGKGQDVFLRSLARAMEKSKVPIKGILVGGGPLKSQMEDLARELGIADKVEFTGHVRDVSSQLSRMRALFLLSYREGLPVSLIEGLACGLPLVGSQVGGIGEIVRDGENGFLVPPGDPEAGAKAMVRLASDAGLAMEFGNRSRELALGSFSLAAMVAGYEEVYQQA